MSLHTVTDEGDTVVVHGRPSGDDSYDSASGEVAIVFRVKTADADPALAERASRLAPGMGVVIDCVRIDDGWYLGRGLEIP